MMTKKLTLIWQANRSTAWENDWIEYLLQHIPHDTVDDWNHSKFIDNSIIVDTTGWGLEPKHLAYMTKMKELNYSFSLIHLSDEAGDGSNQAYPWCKTVLRNYYKKDLPENTITIPLGWNSGFTTIQDNPPTNERTYDWAFIGQRWDQNRQIMAESMRNAPNGVLYIGEYSGPRLTAQQMSKVYRKSIFVICPHGALTADNFRVTEALEAGCIPIVQRDSYYLNFHGIDFPAIQIDSWNQVPQLILQMTKNPEKLEELRQNTYNWWTTRKLSIVDQVTKQIQKTMLNI